MIWTSYILTLCHPNRLRIAYFDPKERSMKKNEMLKGFLSHYQYDSEILTKILEEKQGQMPPFEEPKSRKTEISKPKSWESIAFSLGKQCFC